jgi:hypothetical protein
MVDCNNIIYSAVEFQVLFIFRNGMEKGMEKYNNPERGKGSVTSRQKEVEY